MNAIFTLRKYIRELYLSLVIFFLIITSFYQYLKNIMSEPPVKWGIRPYDTSYLQFGFIHS